MSVHALYKCVCGPDIYSCMFPCHVILHKSLSSHLSFCIVHCFLSLYSSCPVSYAIYLSPRSRSVVNPWDFNVFTMPNIPWNLIKHRMRFRSLCIQKGSLHCFVLKPHQTQGCTSSLVLTVECIINGLLKTEFYSK